MRSISVALAAFNGEKYLREQLASLARQTRLPDELVVTDDGSTDGTIAIIEEFARSAPFTVRIESNARNLGYARNFERAATFCSGDIVFFCDQDDVWHDDKIAAVLERWEGEPTVLTILNDARLVDEGLNWFGQTQYGTIKRVGLADHMFVTGCCSAHQRDWLATIFPVPDGVAHDLWVSRSSHEVGAARILDRPLQDFRRHGENNSGWSISRPQQGIGTALQFHADSGLKGARAGWQFEMDLLETLKSRLIDAPREVIERLGLEGAGSTLDRRTGAYRRRIALCSRPRPARILPLLKMVLRGDYKQFRGLLSAAKDLVRP